MMKLVSFSSTADRQVMKRGGRYHIINDLWEGVVPGSVYMCGAMQRQSTNNDGARKRCRC